MKIAPPTSQLRQDLQRITDQNTGNEGVLHQPGLIEELGSVARNQITLFEPAVPGRPETFHFTCYQYALDIVDASEILTIAINSGHGDAKVGNRFANWLVQEKLIERPPEDVSDGDLVLYFDDHGAKHAGVMRGGLVVSKWGTAHTWQHAIHEVPASSGYKVRFFQPAKRKQAIEWFREFVNTLA
jgi:hypothetical protein